MSPEDPEILDQKLSSLITILKDTPSALLAFSGGVDSSFLLRAMKISGVPFLAITGKSETVPEKDLQQAIAFALQEGVQHRVIMTGELQNESFLNNPPDRCFFCKQDLFQRMQQIAEAESFDALFDGSNADDLKDFRPGRKAARLYGVQSPLAEAGLLKDDIRLLSKKLGLDTWNRPSSPCLSSRFPYGQKITLPLLRRVEQAEGYLKSIGIEVVRVRIHNDVARIEVPEHEMMTVLKNRQAVAENFRSFGFSFISLDLEGFTSGSLNRVLPQDPAGS
ncbi:MAG: ATP-dependent sacrificial sulfur transferase LarE [Nitrospirae bacterium]|nr:ATP-dependent sacrificial sulfur transferase LarE [Nitrospirota bacterium]